MRALELAEARVFGGGSGDDVAHFKQAMERQSGALLSLMMEYRTQEATQAMLVAGARGIEVSLEPEGRTVRVWVYRLM